MLPCCDCRRDDLSRRDFSKAQLKKGPTERRCKPCVERMCEDVDDSLCPEPTASNETKTKMCSACGKSSDALKKCTACKCVWYCDKDCQNKHRKEHKKECKVIKKELDKRGGRIDLGTEKEVGPPGKAPPQEECPICMHALPLCASLTMYAFCCGKSLCGGCNLQHQMTCAIQAAERGQKPAPPTCAFCRTTLTNSDKERVAHISKRVKLKDPEALYEMAGNYGTGRLGLSVDQTKCIDLLRQAADLGYLDAQYTLGTFHSSGDMGFEQNKEKALTYYEKAAEGGHLLSRHNLGCEEDENGDAVAAMRHWRLAASGGFRNSMEHLTVCFESGRLKHGDLAETLRAFYRARAEMRSEDRNKYIAYLKRTGEYDEEYEY